MLKRIDEVAKQHARKVAPRVASLKINIRFHVASMTSLTGIAGAAFRFAEVPTIGLALATVAFVFLLLLILTGLKCLTDHGVL